MEDRATMYKLFSILFSYPKKEVFSNLGIKENIEKLEREYVRLFISSPGTLPCPPYESVYLDGKRRLMSRVPKLMKIYKKAGFEIKPDFKELPDHICVELEFMHLLCRMEREAIKSGEKNKAEKFRKFQREFLREHLLKWVPKFCNDVIQNTTVGFYKEVAISLKNFLIGEKL